MAASGFRSKTAQPNGIASQKTRMYYLLPHIFTLFSLGNFFRIAVLFLLFVDRIQLYTAKKTMHRVHSATHSKFIHPVPEDAREGAAPASCASRSSSTQHSLILFFRNHYILGEKKALRNLTLQWFACVLRRLRKRMRVRNPVHNCHLVILR